VGYGLLCASLAAICWGVAPIFQKLALKDMGLTELNAVRGIGLLAVLLPVFFFGKKDLFLPEANFYMILMFVALVNNVIGDLFAFIAIRDIGVSLASPITSAYPLAVALISWLCFGETMTVFVLAGTFAVVTGLTFLNIRGAAPSSHHLYGVGAACLAALCWALGLSLNKYLTLQGINSVRITFWRGVFFSFMALGNWTSLKALRPEKKRGLKDIPLLGRVAGAWSGVLSLVIGAWFYASSLFMIPMNVATPIASSSPLIAALIACAFTGERLRPIQWLGIAFVISGAVVVTA
jgi:drug/metabolite transporter (DMT)-like permease